MKRLIPVRVILALTFFVTLDASTSHGAVIYSTFGAGDTYNTHSALTIDGLSLADPFTTPGSFTLDTIELAAFYWKGTNSLNVKLLGDSSGKPNSANVLESWNFTSQLQYFNPIILTGTSVSHPLLTSGTQYWLAAFPGDPSFYGGWMDSLIPSGLIASSPDGGTTWITSNTYVPAAFRISGTPVAPVPEPSTMLLLGSGLAGLVGYGRRRMRK